MLQLPILRAGRPYRSLTTLDLGDLRSGEAVARVSLANAGLIARDLGAAREGKRALEGIAVRDLLELCRQAARSFAQGELAVDPVDDVRHGPEDYIAALSATTGMPRALARANMEKIRFVLAEMETVLGGLTRGLDLAFLDSGSAQQRGRSVRYVACADALGVILPSNSPGVHSLWLPAIPLKVPLLLKPGTREPWTPMRVVQALIEAGCPAEAFGFYPTDYAGATEILLRTRRSMFFGDAGTVAAFRGDPRIQIHGPGWSKVLVGLDRIGAWPEHVELMAASIADNGGRSCLNASGIWVAAEGRAVAEAVAAKLLEIEALPLEHPGARLAAFPDPAVAWRISEFIDRQLEIAGAEDVTARLRGRGRITEVEGCTFLLPTLVRCDDPGHPLAACEFLFPFAAVVELPEEQWLERIGPTLVATALTGNERLTAALLASRSIDRLNLGPIPTSRVRWDQPHEGNLFEHLYRQRALQTAHA